MKVLVVADGGQEMALHDNGNGLAPERDRGRWRRSRRCRGIFRRSPGRRRNRPDSVECAFLGGRQTAPPADPQLLLLRCLLLFLRCLLLLLLLLRYLRLRLLLHLSVMTCFLGMGSQERVIIKLLPSVESRSNWATKNRGGVSLESVQYSKMSVNWTVMKIAGDWLHPVDRFMQRSRVRSRDTPRFNPICINREKFRSVRCSLLIDSISWLSIVNVRPVGKINLGMRERERERE